MLPVLLLSLAANQVNGGQRVATVLMYLSDVDEGESSLCCPASRWCLVVGAIARCCGPVCSCFPTGFLHGGSVLTGAVCLCLLQVVRRCSRTAKSGQQKRRLQSSAVSHASFSRPCPTLPCLLQSHPVLLCFLSGGCGCCCTTFRQPQTAARRGCDLCRCCPACAAECGRRGLAVKPRKGAALLFWSLQPDGKTKDMHSLHGGCPVIKGDKWSATKWIRVHEHQVWN